VFFLRAAAEPLRTEKTKAATEPLRTEKKRVFTKYKNYERVIEIMESRLRGGRFFN
jgi:hypothetical protein